MHRSKGPAHREGNYQAATIDRRSHIETSGEVFADGRGIELIRDAETGRLKLLLSDSENCSVAPRVEYGGRVYVPASLDSGILRAVTLPTKFTDYGSTDRLFAAVRDSFLNHGFPMEVAHPTSYFVFSTWFLEYLPTAPCLLITGPRPEASLLIQLLGCLGRHALPLAEVNRVGLSSLPMDLGPTLLIDGEQLSPLTRRLLAASNNRHAYVPWKGTLVNVFCSKAIYCGGTLGDGLLSDIALLINLGPTRNGLPILGVRTEQEIATALQPQLLAYRSRNITKVRESQFDLPAFASPIRILARVLGACIVDAPELQAGLIPLLEEYQERIRGERWTDLRCVVIEALMYHCQDGGKQRVYVGEIARTVGTILKGRGQTPPTDPTLVKLVGAKLSDLGFSRKRDSKGIAIRNTETVRRQIHRFARDHDVAAVQEGLTLMADATRNQDDSTAKEE